MEIRGDGTGSMRIVIVALHRAPCLHSIFLLPWKPVRELADDWETPSESPTHSFTHTHKHTHTNPVWGCLNTFCFNYPNGIQSSEMKQLFCL